MKPLILLLLAVAASAKYVALPAPYEDYCILENKTNRYDPANAAAFPWYNIDLDAPGATRWSQISVQYKTQIKGLIQILINLITPIFPDAEEIVDLLGADMVERFDEPYRDEIKGIAKDTGIPVGQIVIYNIFYEIFTVCTSLVATDNVGNMYHARNLDFGLFMGWDPINHEWPITKQLKTMIINVNWQRNGVTVFKSNNFAGYIGIYNGLRPEDPTKPQGTTGWTLSCNDRFMKEGGYVGIYRWLTGMDPNGQFMSWLARSALTNNASYTDARNYLMNAPILAPVYFIIGGTKPFDGSIVARSLEGTDIDTKMDPSDPNGWYVLETNYDQGIPVLYLDDRRTPGNHCMRYLGRKNVNFQGIFNVLSSRSTLNKLTAYSVLMQAQRDKVHFETIPQSCPGYCYPW